MSVQKLFSGASCATIEDYLSDIVDLLSITERRGRRGATQPNVPVGDQERGAADLQAALDEIKRAISSIIGGKAVEISTHRQFVRAIHGSLQAGRASRRVDYFVLNYDTLIEDALGLERVAYCDGFNGAATGWWDPSKFELDGRPARVFKLHGSIDWSLLGDDPLPRRIRSGVNVISDKNQVLIYPTASKHQETQRDPFAQILQRLRQSLCPRQGEEIVLAIMGYSFGDSHINLEIESALHQSEGRLTVAAFVETDEPQGMLEKWLADPGVSEQIRVYTNKGFVHGKEQFYQDIDLPWWKFEVLSRLLGGER